MSCPGQEWEPSSSSNACLLHPASLGSTSRTQQVFLDRENKTTTSGLKRKYTFPYTLKLFHKLE